MYTGRVVGGHTYFTAVSYEVSQQVNVPSNTITDGSPVIRYGESSMRYLQCAISYLCIIVLHVQDVETVVDDISRGIQQHKNISDVTLQRCCGELTRGVVDGIVVNQCIQKFTLDIASKV